MRRWWFALMLKVRGRVPEGTKVRLTPPNAGQVVTITTNEEHNGLAFYRVEESPGGLFLKSSFEVVK